MNAHGEAPAPDWSLSDLSDEEVERIAERLEGLTNERSAFDIDEIRDLYLAARIIREWNEGR